MPTLALKAFETAKKDIPFERSIKTIIGENSEFPIGTARSYFINSYLQRFFVEKAAIVDYKAYYNLNPKEQAEFRKEVRRLALVEFDRIAKEPVEIPEYLINDAIKLLEKAGLLVFNNLSETIDLLTEHGYLVTNPQDE